MRGRNLAVVFVVLAACSSQRGSEEKAPARTTQVGGDIRAEFASVGPDGARFQMVPPALATGFAASSGRLVPQFGAPVALPARADGAFRVERRKTAIEVRVLGASPVAARTSGGDVHYDGALDGATIVHVPTLFGTEEFVRFAAAPKTREVRYEVRLENARGLRLYDKTLEVLGEGGVPQIHTRAPWIMDANGVMRQGDLRIEGCAYDRDEAAPWGRATTAPGADRCTVVTTWDDEGLSYPLLVDPAWTSAGTLAQDRHAHGAAAIKTTSGTCSSAAGCVLVAGGLYGSSATVLSSAELYESGSWATVTAMPTPREGLTLTSLDDGRAALIGGRNGATYYTAVYTYNPNAVTKWQALGTLSSVGRAYGAATFVKMPTFSSSFRYLVFTGGYNSSGTPVKTVDVYGLDATTPAWSAGTDMLAARADHAMYAYADLCLGPSCVPTWYYFVAGGQSVGGTISSIERTRNVGAPSKIGDLSSPKKNLAVARSGGSILFAGGTGDGSTATNQIDAVAISAAATVTKGVATLGSARFNLAGASFVAGGETRALFTGGSSGTAYTAVGRYDTDVIRDAGSGTFDVKSLLMLGKHANHRATTLADESVLVTGGNYGLCGVATCSYYYYAGAELFKPLANGTACSAGAECASWNCVDGVCCDTTCTGQCEACNIAGKVGTCSAASGAPVGSRPACAAYGTTCGSSCDGSKRDGCVYAGPSTVCSAASCDSVKNEQSLAATCNGSGACNVPVKSACNPYACGATACKTSCASNTDCATGFKCSGTGCVPSGDKGATCTMDSDCLAPNKCVDGVCCGSASCPSGQKCNIPGSVGDCRLPYGAACTAATAASCPTGKCADGVCCDTLCTGQCEACNVAGSVGTCIAVSGAPRGTRTACVGTGACKAQCNGSDRTKCGDPPGVSTVCAAASCSSAVATPTRYCDGLGSCAPAATSPCDPFVCGPTACKTTCASNADCKSGYFCDTSSGSCVTTGALGTVCTSSSQCASGKCTDGVCCTVDTCPSGLVCNANGSGTCSKPLGSTCTASSDCGSGSCVDGVCCNTACDKQCEACDVAGSVGTCVAVAGKPHGTRTACAGTGACQASCDGSDRTKCGAPPGTSTTCATPSCSAGIATPPAYCDGAGNCGTPTKKACAPYTCDATDCKTTCVAESDCAAGYTCKDNACVPKAGVACTTAADCKSGYCVDGVCCDGGCTGLCEACDVAGSEGKCSPITGNPHGARGTCFDGAGDVCKALTCDGTKDRLKCVAFAKGPESTCGGTSCVDTTTELEAPRCDGAGACKMGTSTHPCGGYVCASGACKTSCASASDCASGYVCNGGKCEPAPQSKCNADDTQSIPSDATKPAKDCAPYKCNTATGDCFSVCTDSDQCGAGAICDGGACKPAAVPDTGDGGGCIASPRQARLGGGAIVFLLTLAGVAARRRR